MENKGIWDLIAKIASPIKQNSDGAETTLNNNEGLSGSSNTSVPKANQSPLCGSFSKSYNPFSALEKQKNQILGLKAQKPTKTVIELKNSKPVTKPKGNDKNHNIIELINNHNRYVSLAKKDNGKN